MTNLIVITGSKGAGKSTAAATYVPPKEMAKALVIDTENSMSDIKAQVKFGEYIDAYEQYKPDAKMLESIAAGNLPWVSDTQRNALSDYYYWFVKAIDARLTDKKFKYVIIDTVEPLEAAFTAAVQKDPKKFGWSGDKTFGRIETEGVRPLYQGLLSAIYARGVETIILTTHLHSVWEKDKPVLNKVKPGGRLALLTRLSTLMLWMVPSVGNEDGAPAALVLKARMGKMVATEEGWKTQRILPQRIPHFSWIDVENYKKNPANLAEPKVGEVPTEGEQEMISEMLTNEQMRLMVAGAEIEAKLMQEPSLLTRPAVQPEAIIALHGTGLQPAEIAQQLGVGMPIVINAIRSLSASPTS
jgi:AAA domain